MATLHLENVPDDLLEAIEESARSNHSTIGDEILQRLRISFPTKADLANRLEIPLVTADRALFARTAPALPVGWIEAIH